MTLIGLAPLLGSVTRRGGTCKRRARFLNRIHAGRAPLASAGHIPPRDVGPHRVTPMLAALSPPCFEGFGIGVTCLILHSGGPFRLFSIPISIACPCSIA